MPVIYFNLFWSENKENWWVAAQQAKERKEDGSTGPYVARGIKMK